MSDTGHTIEADVLHDGATFAILPDSVMLLDLERRLIALLKMVWRLQGKHKKIVTIK